jgi:phage-related protein (TIGR01555 family)
MAAKIVDLPAEEMTRAGISIRSPEDLETGDELVKEHKRLKTANRLKDAVSKTRCMGGAIILINVTDGVTDPRQPINEAGLQSVDSLTVFEPGEAQVFEWIANPTAEDYGLPASYQINPRVVGMEATRLLQGVHHSRVIRFSGPMISRDLLNSNHGFGLSVLDHVWEVLSRFDQNYASAGALIDDFSQAVFKIKGLYKSMSTNGGADIKKRLELMDAYRSMLRGIALDADGEEFDRKPTPMTGLSDVIDRFAHRLAAAVNWPLTVLMGKSPSGLAATGDNDTLMWYDQIKRDQVSQLQPAYERLNRLLMLAKKGPTSGKEVEGLTIEFNPLWQPSQAEQATTHLAQAQADQIYLQAGALDVEELRKSRWGGASYSVNTQIEDEDSEDDSDDLNELEGTTRIDPETGLPVQVKPGETQPVPQPGAPGIKPAGGLTPADTAMNGVQVTSMVGVVTAVVKGEISRASGIAILIRAFRVTAEEANAIVGPEDFEAEPDPIALAKAEAIKNPPKPPPGAPAGGPPGFPPK